MNVKTFLETSDRGELFKAAKERIWAYDVTDDLFDSVMADISCIKISDLKYRLTVGTAVCGDGSTLPVLMVKDKFGDNCPAWLSMWRDVLASEIDECCFESFEGVALAAEILAEMLELGTEEFDHDCEVERELEKDAVEN